MKDFAQLLKLPPSILSAIALGTGLALFLPQNLLVKLGLANIPQLWRTVLGIAFIISSSLVIIYLLIKLTTSFRSYISKLQLKRQFPKMMNKLRYEERIVIALLYRSPNYTSRLPLTDGVTLRLQSKCMIQLTSSNSITYGDNMITPFTITPIAQNYIDNHLDFVNDFSKAELQNLYDKMNNPFCM